MNIERSSTAEFFAGADTVGTTAKQAGIALQAARGVTIKADAANADKVYVGHNASVDASSGFALAAGEFVEIAVDSLDKVYVVGGAASQKYSWLVV
jgi:hypothetical protein